MEVLGAKESFNGNTCDGHVFEESGLQSITIPSTLKQAECETFAGCKNLKKIEFLEGRETLGKDEECAGIWNAIFRKCGVEEVMLPSTLKEISSDIFEGCETLRIVRTAKGCKAKVKNIVDSSVEVRRK